MNKRARTPISLLHTTVLDMESQSWRMESQPAVTNCWSDGCAARAHTSEVWPNTTSEKPSSKEPERMQFLVEPTRSCGPRPWAIVLTPPRWPAIYNTQQINQIRCRAKTKSSALVVMSEERGQKPR